MAHTCARHAPQCSHASAEVRAHKIRQDIEREGWNDVGVLVKPPFNYTIGLKCTWGHPELVIAGLDPDQAHGVLTPIVAQIAEGTVFRPGRDYGGVLGDGFLVRFRPLDLHRIQDPVRFTHSDGFYGHPVRRFQVLWPDRDGVFPGTPDCDTGIALRQHIGG